MRNVEYPSDEPKPLPGWICAAIGVGFVSISGLAIYFVMMVG
jgi:hypothetical protein